LSETGEHQMLRDRYGRLDDLRHSDLPRA
jgi:hypothetical protein